MTALRRSPGERALAWLYTGPVGHLYGAIADLAVVAAALARTRARQGTRLEGAGSRRSARL